MTVNTATARYEGLGKAGRGHVATGSGVLDAPYGFASRFEGQPGTNPEEMVAAAHASCFTMATSFALAGAGHNDGTLATECKVTLEKDGDGFTVTRSDLKLTAKVPGINQAEFERLAGEAKAGCPISKLLNCEITLETVLTEAMAAEVAG
jgi:osmotically inducible protein OsmC